jgi:hypothetical protein
MNIRRISVPALLAAAVFMAPSSHAAVLFQVQMHFASGPISLGIGQSANTCAVNPDSETVPVLIALLAADNSTVLAIRQATLQPGAGVCLNYTRVPNNVNVQPQSVYAVVVPNGSLDANGRIFQFAPGGGGGCIVASLQIQVPVLGQTILYAQMIRHDHTAAGNSQGGN